MSDVDGLLERTAEMQSYYIGGNAPEVEDMMRLIDDLVNHIKSDRWPDLADAIVVLLYNAQPSEKALHSYVPNRCIHSLADALAALNLPQPADNKESK